DFEHGVKFVDLTKESNLSGFLKRLGSALDVEANEERFLRQRIALFLHDKRLLLVLDNCEQLTTSLECTKLVAELLTRSDIRILATSRRLWNVTGEQPYEVGPLALPDPEVVHDVTALIHHPAVRIFIERTKETGIDFEVTQENRHLVLHVC